jgi:hypothetical protein
VFKIRKEEGKKRVEEMKIGSKERKKERPHNEHHIKKTVPKQHSKMAVFSPERMLVRTSGLKLLN